jgi:hypothetical protein
MISLKGKVILLNSPPNSGKDFAAGYINGYTGAKHCEFKNTLHNIAIAVTGLDEDSYYAIYNDRDKKEQPQPEFFGMTPRQMLIWISEDVCKPKFGERFFGMSAANTLDLEYGSVFSDSGFPEEVFPLAERVGAENIYVVRFNRNGSTFNGDSRNYLQPCDCPKGVNFIDMKNDGDIVDFVEDILALVDGGCLGLVARHFT